MHLPFNSAPLPETGPEDFVDEAERIMAEKQRHTAVMWSQEGFGPILGAAIQGGEYKNAVAALYNPTADRYGLSLFYCNTGKMAYHTDVHPEGGQVTDESRTGAHMHSQDYTFAIGLLDAMKFSKAYTSLTAQYVSEHRLVTNWSFLPHDSLPVACKKAMKEYGYKILDEMMLGMRSMWRLPPDLRR